MFNKRGQTSLKLDNPISFPSRNPIIDNLYTYGMLLVVLGHIGLKPNFDTTYLYKWIYSFHMPLFFFIAGYLFKLRKDGIKQFIIKKTKRLIVPLVIITSIVFFPKVLLSSYALRPLEGGISNLLFSLIIPSKNPVQPLWFLNVLYGVYLGALLIYILIKDNPYGWFVISIICFLLSSRVDYIPWFGVSSIIYYFPFFCFGVIFKKYNLLSIERSEYPLWIVLLFLVLLSIEILLPLNKYLIAFTGIASAIVFIGWLYKKGIPFFPNLRPYTFCIYLLQWFPMVLVRVLFYKVLNWNEWICYIMMFGFGLFVPVLLAKLTLKLTNAKSKLGNWVLTVIGLA